MNKFVLSSFLIIAIFMAQLPSNSACKIPPPRLELEKEVNEYFDTCLPHFVWENDVIFRLHRCCIEINKKYGSMGGTRYDPTKMDYPAELVPACVDFDAGKSYQSRCYSFTIGFS